MSMIEAVRTVLHRYADFKGRARLSEYWWWTLAHGGIILVLFALCMIVGFATMDPVTEDPGPAILVPLLFLVLFVLATFLPDLAVTVRRLHDSDKSGWWLLLGLEPTGIGGIVILVFTLVPGTPGWNQHGPNPKDEGFPGMPGPYGTAPDYQALPPYGGPPQPYVPGGLPQPTTPGGPYGHQPYPSQPAAQQPYPAADPYGLAQPDATSGYDPYATRPAPARPGAPYGYDPAPAPWAAPSGNDPYQAPPAPSPSDTPSYSPPDTSSSSSSDSSSSSSY